jgi:hypothetical protein
VRVLFDGNCNEYFNFEGHKFPKYEWEISLLHNDDVQVPKSKWGILVTYDGIILTLIFGNYIRSSTYLFGILFLGIDFLREGQPISFCRAVICDRFLN